MADPFSFNIGYDPSSLATLANFAKAEAFFSPEIAIALEQSGWLVTQAAQAMTWSVFANPHGDLAGSIIPVMSSPVEVLVQVGVPYGRRMEEGFHGADSLGRVYDQEGKPYLEPALAATEDQIMALLGNAAAVAMAKMAGR